MKDSKLWPTKYKMSFLTLAMIAGLLIFSGCSSVKQMNINIQGMPEMNNGNAVVVYICQLSNEKGFMQATYESFWQGDDKPFQDEVIKGTNKRLFPNASIPEMINIDSETKFIGIAADFFDPDEEAWRRIYPLTSKPPKQIVIIVGINKIDIQY